ncbi:MAG: glycosyltransferase family 9 protein [bacterium]
MNNYKDFLIFGHNYIGDVLMLTPAIRALKLKFPESRITVVASKNASYVLKRNPDVWKIVEAENIRGIRGIIGILKLYAAIRSINKINKHKFYACVNFLASFKFAVLGFLLAKKQVGQEKFLNNFFLRDRINLGNSLHNIDKSLKFIEPFHSAASALSSEKYFSRNCVYDVEGEDIENAGNILKNFFNGENFKFVLFSPGSTRKSKEANPETFSLFADYLNKKGFYVVITGSKKDMRTSKKIYEKIKNKRMSADLTGLTDIYTLGGLIKESNLVVSVDNGTMHLSAAIKTPLIALFGSTDPAVCGPLADNARIIDKKTECYHCFDKNCSKGGFNMRGYPDCMGYILPEDLIKCAETLL